MTGNTCPLCGTDQSASFQRDNLAEALRKLLVTLGVIRSDAAPNGPELLMCADDYVKIQELAVEEVLKKGYF